MNFTEACEAMLAYKTVVRPKWEYGPMTEYFIAGNEIKCERINRWGRHESAVIGILDLKAIDWEIKNESKS